ncbi:Transposable element P transposase, partial [Paramuricea clavata]
MPNCAFYNCFHSRRYKNVSLFQIPVPRNSDSEFTFHRKEEARNGWINAILRTRQLDANLKTQIENNNIHICESHFKEEYIENFSKRKSLQTGSIPTESLPVKSFDHLSTSFTSAPRKEPAPRHVSQETTIIYASLDKFDAYLKKAGRYPYFQGWNWFKEGNNTVIEFKESEYLIAKFSSSKSVKTQLVPLLPNDSSPQYRTVEYCRALSCRVLVSSILSDSKQLQCESCSRESNSNVGNFNVASIKCKTPLSCLSKEQLIATVKDTRVNLKEAKLKCAQLERRVQRMENEIKHHGIRIETGLEKELTSIITNTSLEATPHMKLVWEQKKKALNQQSNFGNRWHPHFIRFCLSIYSKSPIVYQELRDSGTMQLPSSRTWRSYRNNFKPGAGYLPENIKSLISRTKGFLDKDRWIVVMFDEMKIKCNLVFDKHSGRLIGFVDLGDPDINYSTFDKIEPATHVLAFYVRGITTKLQFMLGYFFTRDVVSYQLMPLFWRGVAILQLKANLNVIAAVSDGASPNRKFYQLHIYIGEKLNNQKVVYKTKNLFAPGKWICFFADAPHLLKTGRNCLLNSGS